MSIELPPLTVYLTTTIKTLPDYRNPRILHQKYIVEKLSARKLAELFEVSKSTILENLRRFNIPIRSQGNGAQTSDVDEAKTSSNFFKNSATDENSSKNGDPDKPKDGICICLKMVETVGILNRDERFS